MRPDEKSAILARHRSELEAHAYGDNFSEDLTHIAQVITAACQEMGVDIPVVVGGFAVEFYTMGEYVTHDLDMVTTANTAVAGIMRGLGFEQRIGFRYWTHPLIGGVVEFPEPPLAGSQDRVAIS
jgi:hypothetical protein